MQIRPFLRNVIVLWTLIPSSFAINGTHLKNIGIILYQGFEMQDAVNFIDPLQLLSVDFPMNLYLLAETLEPVTTLPSNPLMNPQNSSYYPSLTPTHTFAQPPDLDVLVVPGGPGSRVNYTAVTDFLNAAYPRLKFFVTVCTGAGVAARSTVLDGRFATTNKRAWSTMVAINSAVKWTAPARWVVDGNVWTSSGVTAGLDMAFQFIEQFWGSSYATTIANTMEHPRITNPCDDPYAAIYNVTAKYHLPGCGCR